MTWNYGRGIANAHDKARSGRCNPMGSRKNRSLLPLVVGERVILPSGDRGVVISVCDDGEIVVDSERDTLRRTVFRELLRRA